MITHACTRFCEIVSFTKHRQISEENEDGEKKPLDASQSLVSCKDLNRITDVIMHNNSSIRFPEEQEIIQENSSCFRFPVFQVDKVPQNLIVLNCAMNVLFLITASLGNLLVISAVWKTPSLRCPSNVLLCGLETSDLAVGLVVQPLFLYIELMQIIERPAKYPCALGHAFIIVSYSVCGVSLLTVTAISVDRLLALQYHLRYVNIVTAQRVSYLILFIWLASTSLGSLILWKDKTFLVIMALVVGICLCLSVLVHLKIYRFVRHHQHKSVSTKCRLQIADCRLQTGYKMQTRYKMQTADCRLGTKCRLSINK